MTHRWTDSMLILRESHHVMLTNCTLQSQFKPLFFSATRLTTIVLVRDWREESCYPDWVKLFIHTQFHSRWNSSNETAVISWVAIQSIQTFTKTEVHLNGIQKANTTRANQLHGRLTHPHNGRGSRFWDRWHNGLPPGYGRWLWSTADTSESRGSHFHAILLPSALRKSRWYSLFRFNLTTDWPERLLFRVFAGFNKFIRPFCDHD